MQNRQQRKLSSSQQQQQQQQNRNMIQQQQQQSTSQNDARITRSKDRKNVKKQQQQQQSSILLTTDKKSTKNSGKRQKQQQLDYGKIRRTGKSNSKNQNSAKVNPTITTTNIRATNRHRKTNHHHRDCSTETKDLSSTSSSSSTLTNESRTNLNKNSGFITCLVCNQTKYYSHVQRRYGIFSCEPCFKFFSRFLKEPKHFQCNDNGECLIVLTNDDNNNQGKNAQRLSNGTGGRCKACWLKLCIEKFKIDCDTRRTLMEKYCQKSEIIITVDNNKSKTPVTNKKHKILLHPTKRQKEIHQNKFS
uniref:Nuclear receptor domain-containing protein n=1 Tax=Dermatophagoides pteronyssinus TaxID=6956 RepID=A0A6P6YHJ1_DERPT|nr:putative uncharacterized protein DDB_G0282129 [Dermatophagoides pteronyssinus]